MKSISSCTKSILLVLSSQSPIFKIWFLISGSIESNTVNYQTNDEIQDIDKNIEEIKQLATLADKHDRDVPKDRIQELYEKITKKISHLIGSLKTSQNAYKILNNKEIDQTINSITNIKHDPLKNQLLVLLKTLFDVAPVTTNELLPPYIMDKLLDIFKNDNKFLKTHAVNIINKWLPNNPKIQARLMKLNGLELFYDQVTKLDTSLVYDLLVLFNNILEEHLLIRSKSLKDQNDFETVKLYENIGLIDKISTPALCNGLLNIFAIISKRNDFEIQPSVYHLLKNVKPFCLRSYYGKLQAAKILEMLKDHVNDLNEEDLQSIEVKKLLDEYINYIKEGEHDEF